MPRRARRKNSQSIYHVMCRSISEVLLFRNESDKDYYLSLIKRYKNKYHCSIYAFCLMSNHLHLHIDPRGFDLSNFMQSVDVAYVRYYNKKYERRGPLFQDRFVSRIVDSDGYNLAVSAYIHNNAKDIKEYDGKEEKYPYSSYGIYAGIARDHRNLIDMSFILGLFHETNRNRFGKRYLEYVKVQRDRKDPHASADCTNVFTGFTGRVANSEAFSTTEGAVEVAAGGTTESDTGGASNIGSERSAECEYRSGRKIILRNHSPGKIMTYISGRLMINRNGSIGLKSKERVKEYRALCVYFMRTLCGMGYREICENIYNMTVSGCSSLCSKGYELVIGNEEYMKIFDELCCQMN